MEQPMLTVNPDIFREFSIRGLADRDLTDEVVFAIGQSVGIYFSQHSLSSLVVGNDVRLSSKGSEKNTNVTIMNSVIS